MIKRKAKPATAEPLLLGVTKASLTTQSFISAAAGVPLPLGEEVEAL